MKDPIAPLPLAELESMILKRMENVEKGAGDFTPGPRKNEIRRLARMYDDVANAREER